MSDATSTQTADSVLAAERKRTADLKAAFPKDPAFALQAIEAGWSVTEAKAQRHDELEKQAAAKVKGSDGVPYADSESAPPTNFIQQARELARKENISRTEAMRRLATEQPQLYESFRASEAKRTVLSK